MRRLTLTALLIAPLACSENDPQSRGRVVESSAGTVELGIRSAEYRPGAIASPAALAGVVSANGVPGDSIIPVQRDAGICGDSAAVREVRLEGTSLANALVWVEGVTTGKPLPELRRTTLTIEGCRIDPRVTAVVSGTTVNLFSRDRVSHHVRFFREGAGTPVAHALTVDAGQVVPSEAIGARPGIVEARCEMHPWVRGYVAVFAHPYFAVTDASGAFAIDQLPAGTYTVKVWHEGMERPAEQRVAVGAGGRGQLDLQVALK